MRERERDVILACSRNLFEHYFSYQFFKNLQFIVYNSDNISILIENDKQQSYSIL